jgi:hypothetical protein
MPGAYTTGSYVAFRISAPGGVAHAMAAARKGRSITLRPEQSKSLLPNEPAACPGNPPRKRICRCHWQHIAISERGPDPRR